MNSFCRDFKACKLLAAIIQWYKHLESQEFRELFVLPARFITYKPISCFIRVLNEVITRAMRELQDTM